MAATTGAFHEATKYAASSNLPLNFIVEDNGLSCDSPTEATWGYTRGGKYRDATYSYYHYARQWPHIGTGNNVAW